MQAGHGFGAFRECLGDGVSKSRFLASLGMTMSLEMNTRVPRQRSRGHRKSAG